MLDLPKHNSPQKMHQQRAQQKRHDPATDTATLRPFDGHHQRRRVQRARFRRSFADSHTVEMGLSHSAAKRGA